MFKKTPKKRMEEFRELNWDPITSYTDYSKPTHIACTTRIDPKVALTTLRNIIQSSNDQELKQNFPQDDKSLNKFLNARKLNVDSAFKLIHNYYWYRKKNATIFRNMTIENCDIKDCIRSCLPGVLPSKDRKGRCVLLFLANNWDCTYGLISIYRTLLFTLEYLLEDVHNQSNGFVVIVDWTEFSFRKTSHFGPSILKLIVEGLQNCFPARFKGVHFLGQPWYVEAALMAIKPFLNEKIKDRIYMHGNNLSVLHEHVHKDVLPAELGGERPSYNPEQWLKTVENGQKII
ncbi:clavesin-1-like isoform X1 [Harmonia axyridis]|uniref:clavesin-1-like isoform X1 n=2 Tax=Harmonia axyridis TaxID=115357 RepID=UPI001E27534B|nr:clavesin-1-like isoform X1 [Harmonia axyridis]